MDVLDHLAGPAADLLGRVDDLLAEAGAPDHHRIWPLLHRLRALPGAAADAVIALRPEPLAAASAELRHLISGYGDASATLTAEVAWEGAGADSFAARRAALAAHLAGSPESLAGRLTETATGLEAVADWMSAARVALARTLAEVLGSAEAVAIVIGPPAAPTAEPAGGFSGAVTAAVLSSPAAAAEIGARVLATAAEIHDRGEALRQQWSSSLAEVAAFRPPSPVGGRLDATTRIAF